MPRSVCTVMFRVCKCACECLLMFGDMFTACCAPTLGGYGATHLER